jgi:hypothetical protein
MKDDADDDVLCGAWYKTTVIPCLVMWSNTKNQQKEKKEKKDEEAGKREASERRRRLVGKKREYMKTVYVLTIYNVWVLQINYQRRQSNISRALCNDDFGVGVSVVFEVDGGVVFEVGGGGCVGFAVDCKVDDSVVLDGRAGGSHQESALVHMSTYLRYT